MRPPQTLSLLLWPLSAAYGGIVRLRSAMYRHDLLATRRLGGTVISVGNLTVGGTGKTPMVLWLAERLAAEGHTAAILTRGYGAKAKAGANAQTMPDEAALLQQRLGDRAQLGVGKNRYASGHALEKRGAQWFILDDGFQHLALARDVNILLVDATDPFGGGRMLPAGSLREPRTALARADIVVITRADHAPAVETIVRRFTPAPVFYAHTELESIVRVPQVTEELSVADRANTQLLAFCGIGNPAAFFYDLRRWGLTVAGERAFRDHHRYTPSDMTKLERAAASAGAGALICTEKDVFNLRGAPETRLPLYACRIRLVLPQGDAFWSAVLVAVQRNKAAARQ